MNNNAPAIREARLSACSRSPCLPRNRRNTTTAETSSIVLSPPNANRAGLRAIQAADSDAAASTLIHTIVIAWIRWMRRIRSCVGVCGIEAIEGIMARCPCQGIRVPLDMRRMNPECPDSDSSDRSVVADVILRQEPDEEEEEEENDDDGT